MIRPQILKILALAASMQSSVAADVRMLSWDESFNPSLVTLTAPWFLAVQAPLSLEQRITRLEHRVSHLNSVVGAGLIAGVICALWAQNTGRNPWLWFFAGLIFSVITLFVMLARNSEDIRQRRAVPRPPPRT